MSGTDRMVTWLRDAMDAAERTAQATTPVPVAGRWAAVRDKDAAEDAPLHLIQGQVEDDPATRDYSHGVPVIAYAADWQDEAEANLRHIAANDPHSVLRRIAADRQILDRYEEAKRVLLTYADPNDAILVGAELVTLGHVMRLLAEGWGWTEETT